VLGACGGSVPTAAIELLADHRGRRHVSTSTPAADTRSGTYGTLRKVETAAERARDGGGIKSVDDPGASSLLGDQ
jgi:hypothetical protein